MFGIHASGVYPIAPTPFTDNGEIDFASTDRMVEWWGEIGATGMTVLGIMGEAPKLDMAESVAFVDRCIRRAGKVSTMSAKSGASPTGGLAAGDGRWAPTPSSISIFSASTGG